MKTKWMWFRVALTAITGLIAFCSIALNRGFLADVVWTNVALVTHYFRLHTIARPLGWLGFLTFALFIGWIVWKLSAHAHKLVRWINRK